MQPDGLTRFIQDYVDRDSAGKRILAGVNPELDVVASGDDGFAELADRYSLLDRCG